MDRVRFLMCWALNVAKTAKDYTILAIADTESENLNSIFESQIFQKALCAIYPKEAQSLLDKCYVAEEPYRNHKQYSKKQS